MYMHEVIASLKTLSIKFSGKKSVFMEKKSIVHYHCGISIILLML